MRVSRSQSLVIFFLSLYCLIIYYYLHLNDEKSQLKETIIQQKILSLHKELQEITISINQFKGENQNLNENDLNTSENELKGERTKNPIVEVQKIPTNKPAPLLRQQTQPPRQEKPRPKPSPISLPGVLVVGGTDGSGTRRVVQLLTQLGVTIVSEDPETYDIHADLFGGWPKVVEPLLKSTGSITYDINDIPLQLRTSTENNLRRLLQQAEKDSKKPQSKILAVGGALPTPSNVHSSRVKYGFKAPVAMTLVPWWKALNQHFLFLHVIRDGRDIAFSANQGPVVKFYEAMYHDHPEKFSLSDPVKAMQLWSDWNMGIKLWAEEKKKELEKTITSSTPPSSTFDYLSLHIEDLVDERREVRYQAMKRVADFVGSDLDEESLCCLSAEGSKFMGSHDRNGKVGENAEKTLKKKYGKWKSLLAGNSALENQLISAGGRGLKELGYPLNAADSSHSADSLTSCTLTIAQCDARSSGLSNWRSARTSPPKLSYLSNCQTESNTDYRGGDIATATDLDLEGCCRQCDETVSCVYFTFNTENGVCYMKSRKVEVIQNYGISNLVSGQVKKKGK